MKKFIVTILIFTGLSVQATIRTVNNNPAGLAQFSDLQSAINASASGDTVYVHGSVNSYGNVEVIDKKLTIIGPGLSPDKNGPLLTAMVNFIGIYNLNTNNSDGSALIGLHITTEARISSTGSGNSGYPVNGVKVIRNKFTNATLALYAANPYGSIHMYNLYVEGNYFEQSSIASASTSYYFTNCSFVNNVFARTNGFGGSISNMNNCTNVVFDHNLFYGDQATGNRLFDNYASGLTMKNNVFVNMITNNTHPNGSYSIFNIFFQNNITYNCTNNTPWNLGSNLNGGGNIDNQDPQMVAQNAINTGTFNPLLDFSIASGPANNTGTDGKDLGVLFDETSTMNWAYGRNSRLPYIHTMNVLNSSVPAGGTLNVQIQARKAK